MIRARRMTIGGTMWASFIVCLGLAALRNASETWAGAVLLVTCGVLACATVAAICRPAAERPWWLGFALFGWGYLWLVFRGSQNLALPELPTSNLVTVSARLFTAPPPRPFLCYGPSPEQFAYWQIGHCLWALTLAAVGGLLALAVCARSRGGTDMPVAVREHTAPVKPKWWRRPAMITLVGCTLFLMVALVGYPHYHQLLVGIAYVLTGALVGTAVVGAALGGGGRRAEWLGAALFGGCCLGFQLAAVPPGDETRPPYLAANQFLGAARPWFIAGVRLWHGTAFVSEPKDARIRQKLEQPIPMEFSQETPLDDVLRYIRTATEGPDGDGIPIYVDPVGLQEAEKTLQSPIQLHLVGVPLRVTLSLLLKQLGMTYHVRDGLLLITSQTCDGCPQEALDDPYLLIGHCVLTCLAAALGSLLGPLVTEARQSRTARRMAPS